MCVTCNTCGRNDKCVLNFSQKTLKERDYLENLDIDGSVILNVS
jgi:hypothetical protein